MALQTLSCRGCRPQKLQGCGGLCRWVFISMKCIRRQESGGVSCVPITAMGSIHASPWGRDGGRGFTRRPLSSLGSGNSLSGNSMVLIFTCTTLGGSTPSGRSLYPSMCLICGFSPKPFLPAWPHVLCALSLSHHLSIHLCSLNTSAQTQASSSYYFQKIP